jgi:hypothetical protein
MSTRKSYCLFDYEKWYILIPLGTVVIYFAIKKKLIKYAVAIYVAMCCQSLATLGCMHILMYNIVVHQSGGRVRQNAQAVKKSGLCRQKFAQDFSFKIFYFWNR